MDLLAASVPFVWAAVTFACADLGFLQLRHTSGLNTFASKTQASAADTCTAGGAERVGCDGASAPFALSLATADDCLVTTVAAGAFVAATMGFSFSSATFGATAALCPVLPQLFTVPPPSTFAAGSGVEAFGAGDGAGAFTDEAATEGEGTALGAGAGLGKALAVGLAVGVSFVIPEEGRADLLVA